MISYITPITSLNRLIQNDFSGKFKIIIKIKRIDTQNESIIIERQNEISINSTINKARIISKIINDEYAKDPTISHYIFDISQIEEKIHRKIKVDEIIEFFNTKINHLGEEMIKQDSDNEITEALSNLLDGKDCITLCEYHQKNEIDGIISYIRKVTNGNVDGKNDNLKLSTGSNENPLYPLSNIIHYDNVYINFMAPLKTTNIEDTWIEFDFVHRKVNVTSYTICLQGHNQYCNNYPKSWKIMGSNDHEWELIDVKINMNETNYDPICHFECDRKSGYYRYIRFIQLDSNATNDAAKYAICISCIEFFGSVA